jgi:hypothetical protein
MAQKTIKAYTLESLDKQVNEWEKRGYRVISGISSAHDGPESVLFFQVLRLNEPYPGVEFVPSIEWDMEFHSVVRDLIKDLKDLTAMLFYEGYNRPRLDEINERIQQYDDLVDERANVPKK